MTNVMDIIIVDLEGIEYDINDIKVEGNDVMTIRILFEFLLKILHTYLNAFGQVKQTFPAIVTNK